MANHLVNAVHALEDIQRVPHFKNWRGFTEGPYVILEPPGMSIFPTDLAAVMAFGAKTCCAMFRYMPTPGIYLAFEPLEAPAQRDDRP